MPHWNLISSERSPVSSVGLVFVIGKADLEEVRNSPDS